MTTPLLTTGLNGLIGSKLATTFASDYTFDNLDISNAERPVDITDEAAVMGVISESPATAIVHFAAYTDVTGAWQQTDDTSGPAYRVNVLGTQNIAKAAAATGKQLIHISTAYVFDGNNPEPYLETDPLKPIEWYGQTKALAEEAVQKSGATWSILRIDQPFRSDPAQRPDVVRRVAQQLQEGTLKPQFADHFMGPTFIDDFVKVIDWVIRTQSTGVWHASSGEMWSDFDFATEIQKQLKLNGEIKPGSLTEYLKTAARPYQRNTSLNCDKLKKQLDFTLQTVPEALAQVRLA